MEKAGSVSSMATEVSSLFVFSYESTRRSLQEGLPRRLNRQSQQSPAPMHCPMGNMRIRADWAP